MPRTTKPCDAATSSREAGLVECDLPNGHRGDHHGIGSRSKADVTWMKTYEDYPGDYIEAEKD